MMEGTLRRCREAAGLTQVDVALKLNVDRSSVSYWESGRAKPAADKIPLLADLYGCSIDALYGRTTAPPPQ